MSSLSSPRPLNLDLHDLGVAQLAARLAAGSIS
ncbi:MAG: hypothetical protein JWP47_55, partial [Polaromonas sp.]|nr:hypothetical protein [Polaromonas sp.]